MVDTSMVQDFFWQVFQIPPDQMWGAIASAILAAGLMFFITAIILRKIAEKDHHLADGVAFVFAIGTMVYVWASGVWELLIGIYSTLMFAGVALLFLVFMIVWRTQKAEYYGKSKEMYEAKSKYYSQKMEKKEAKKVKKEAKDIKKEVKKDKVKAEEEEVKETQNVEKEILSAQTQISEAEEDIKSGRFDVAKEKLVKAAKSLEKISPYVKKSGRVFGEKVKSSSKYIAKKIDSAANALGSAVKKIDESIKKGEESSYVIPSLTRDLTKAMTNLGEASIKGKKELSVLIRDLSNSINTLRKINSGITSQVIPQKNVVCNMKLGGRSEVFKKAANEVKITVKEGAKTNLHTETHDNLYNNISNYLNQRKVFYDLIELYDKYADQLEKVHCKNIREEELCEEIKEVNESFRKAKKVFGKMDKSYKEVRKLREKSKGVTKDRISIFETMANYLEEMEKLQKIICNEFKIEDYNKNLSEYLQEIIQLIRGTL